MTPDAKTAAAPSATPGSPPPPSSTPWSDASRSSEERVASVLAEMTLEEKAGQLIGVWVGASDHGDDVAPHQHLMHPPANLDALMPMGIGQLTRPFGTRPVDPAAGAVSLARSQRRIADSNRFGIPAMAHDECLAGFAAWGATAYPVPVSWAATFNPPLIEEMAAQIGTDMRSVGVHQGLAPVLDVVRDLRWGRVEETMGEDPFLVAVTGTAYVRGLESTGVVATLKHFAGYSASKGARNLGPVSMGSREFADVVLPPFEMAVVHGKTRSVMNSYSDVDGVPAVANRELLTGLLREQWGFDGIVVADYFAVAFLHLLHRTAADASSSAAQALAAGIDVELPNPDAYAQPLIDAVRSGAIPMEHVDTAVERVLRLKAELGLLDADWSPTPPALRALEAEGIDITDADAVRGRISLDTPAGRDIARRIAEQAVVLLSNDGTLPLRDSASLARPARIAVIGPAADFEFGVLGCYSFPAHIGVQYPGTPTGIEIRTLLESITAEFPESTITHVPGTSLDGGETEGIADAVEAARDADVVILALGDRSGLFGRGTSGEGCDVEDLNLPAAQGVLLEAVLDTGTPTVLTLMSGRPYALGTAPTRAAAILQTFFPGEEGTGAIAGVLSGRVNPSGRLPVHVPATAGGQPWTYLTAPLGRLNSGSMLDPTPAFTFGHGIGFGTFAWSDADISAAHMSTDGTVDISVTVTNVTDRPGADVVQLYLHDPVAQVVRPEQRLVGFARVELAPGEAARVTFTVSADLSSFTGRSGERIVEPGALTLGFARSVGDIVFALDVEVTGHERIVDHTRTMEPRVTITPVA
jgi:beta-xylosidase